MTSARPSGVAAVVVLAAGEGSRMRSTTPKVLHELAGRTMLGHVLAAAEALAPEHLLVVVGHGREQVAASLTGKARPVVQESQDGTGHAVRTALDTLPDLEGTVVVLPGDAPLLTSDLLAALVTAHQGAATTLLTARVDDPTGYGRVVRSASGGVLRIVEHKDADEPTRLLDEVGTSVYAFDAAHLRSALARITTDNAQGELYLTDVVGLHVQDGLPVRAHVAPDADLTRGVNDRAQLADLARLLRDRIVRAHLLAGVAFLDPQTAWVDAGVVLEPDCTIAQDCQLTGSTVVRAGATIGPGTSLTDCEVSADATVLRSVCAGARLGERSTTGPFSYVRPGTVLGAGGKIGAFVETKAAVIGEGTKVPHLSYVGDATIGARSNIGAGTIVVNYDGRDKHRTTIGDDVRIGSNNSLVAPVSIGDGAYTGADAVIRHDVPAGALSVSENSQRTTEGWTAQERGDA